MLERQAMAPSLRMHTEQSTHPIGVTPDVFCSWRAFQGVTHETSPSVLGTPRCVDAL